MHQKGLQTKLTTPMMAVDRVAMTQQPDTPKCHDQFFFNVIFRRPPPAVYLPPFAHGGLRSVSNVAHNLVCAADNFRILGGRFFEWLTALPRHPSSREFPLPLVPVRAVLLSGRTTRHLHLWLSRIAWSLALESRRPMQSSPVGWILPTKRMMEKQA